TSADGTGRADSSRRLRGRRGPDNHIRRGVRLRLYGGVRRRWPGAEAVARNTNLNKTWARPWEEKAAPTLMGATAVGERRQHRRRGKTERSKCSTCVRTGRRTPRFRRRRGTGRDFAIGALRRCTRLVESGQILLLLTAWAVAQWPIIVYPDIDLDTAAAPAATLTFVL